MTSRRCGHGPVFHLASFPFDRPFLRPLRSFAGILRLIGTTGKVHSPYRSNEEAGAFACSMLLVLPSGPIPISVSGAGTRLTANSDAAHQPGKLISARDRRVFNDPMLTRLIDRSLVGNRELKILAQDVKDEADEPLSEPIEHKAEEARDCERSFAACCWFCRPVIPNLRHRSWARLPERYNLRRPTRDPTCRQTSMERPASENSAQLGIEEFFNDPMLRA